MDNEEKSKAFVKQAFNGFYTFSFDLKTSSNLMFCVVVQKFDKRRLDDL